MNFAQSWQALGGWVDQHGLLGRLLFSSVEFALLAVFAAAALKLIRPKTPRLVALVWAIVLAKPLLSLVFGSPVNLIHLPAPQGEHVVAMNTPTETLEPKVAVPNSFAETDLQDSSIESDNSDRIVHRNHRSQLNSNGSQLTKHGDESTKIATSPTPATIPDATPKPNLAWLWSAIAWIWCCGMGLMLVRAITVRVQLAKLFAACTPPSAAVAEIYQQLCKSLNLQRTPPLLISDRIESPALVGLWRARILIPSWLAAEVTDQRDPVDRTGRNDNSRSNSVVNKSSQSVLQWSLRHELTHWRHGDLWLIRLRELSRTVFFFHPAAWWAGKQLETAIEIACDRAVIASDADAADYAHGLYKILEAVRHHRRVRLSGGLFATRSQIARRLTVLLGTPLSLHARMGKVAICCVACFAVVALSLGIGLKREADGDDTKPKADTNTVRKSQTESTATGNGDTTVAERKSPTSSQNPLVNVHGKVVSTENKPIANALVALLETGSLESGIYARGKGESRILGETKTDSQGNFQLVLEKQPKFHWNQFVALVASAKDYGVHWENLKLNDVQSDYRFELQSQQELRGQLLFAEDKPAAGINVKLRALKRTDSIDDLYFGTNTDLQSELLNTSLITDAAGNLTLTGIPPQLSVELMIQGSDEIPTCSWIWKNNSELHQNIFRKARGISGTVLATDTGAPLAGAKVVANISPVTQGAFFGIGTEAVTDQNGHYHAIVMAPRDPIPGRPSPIPMYGIQVFSPVGSAYQNFSRSFRADIGDAEQTLDFKLEPGVEIDGRVVELANRAAIPNSEVWYSPRGNAVAMASLGEQVAMTDADGKFHCVVPAGKGDLSLVCTSCDFVIHAVPVQSRFAIGHEYVFAHKEIDLAPNAVSVNLELKLERGAVVEGEITGTDGARPKLVHLRHISPQQDGYNDASRLKWTIEDAHLFVRSVPADGEMPIALLAPDRHEGKLLNLRGSDSSKPLHVVLEKCGSVSVRILDAAGKPVAGYSPQIDAKFPTVDQADPFSMGLYEFEYPNLVDLVSGEDGRFASNNLIPGMTYVIRVPDKSTGNDSLHEFEVEAGKHIDLGDIIISNPSVLNRAAEKWKQHQAKSTGSATRENNQSGQLSSQTEDEKTKSSQAKHRENDLVAGSDAAPTGKPDANKSSDSGGDAKSTPNQTRTVDIVVQATGNGNSNKNLPDTLAAQLAKVKGVKQVVGGLLEVVNFEKEGLMAVFLNGWPADCPLFDGLKIQQGRKLASGDQHQVMLGSALAKNLNKQVGDEVALLAEPFQVVGIFEGTKKFENDGAIVLLEELQRMMHLPGEVACYTITAERPIDDEGLETLRQRLAAVQPGLEAILAKDFVLAPAAKQGEVESAGPSGSEKQKGDGAKSGASKDAAPGNGASNTNTSGDKKSAVTEPVIVLPAKVVGKVVDENEKPVGGVKVQLFAPAPDTGTTTSAADGSFSFTMRQREAGTLVATDEAGKRLGYWMCFPVTEEQYAPKIVLKPQHELTINVVDADGKPVEGATFTSPGANFDLCNDVFSGKTNAEGKATIQYSENARICQLIAFKSGMGLDYVRYPVDQKTPEIGPPLPSGITLKLNGARTVRIKAADPNKQPLAGIEFRLNGLKLLGQKDAAFFDNCDTVKINTDAAGVATFDWLPKDFVGNLTFRKQSPGYDTPLNGGAELELLTIRDQNPKDEINVELRRRGAIAGHVFLPDGKPAAGIHVYGGGVFPNRQPGNENAITAADGSYTMDVRGEAPYVVSIDDAKYAAPAKASVVAREGKSVEDLDFKLSEGTLLHGVVTDGAENRSVANQLVSLQLQAGPIPDEMLPKGFPRSPAPQQSFFRTTKTDAAGKYQFRIGPGEYQLAVPQNGTGISVTIYPETPKTKLTVNDEREIVQNCQLPSDDTFEITFKVLDSDGKPANAASVHGHYMKRPARGSDSFIAKTKADGSLVVKRTAIPAVIFAYSADNQQGAMARVTAEQKELSISLAPLAQASGKLVDEKGQPLSAQKIHAAIYIRLEDLGASIGLFPAESETAADGSFTFTRLLPGKEYSVSTTDKTGRVSDLAQFQSDSGVTNTPQPLGEMRPLRKPDQSAVTTKGKLLDSDGKPLVGITVLADFLQAPISGARTRGQAKSTAPDGEFEIKRPTVPAIFSAQNSDFTQAGITRLDAKQTEATVKFVPLAEAHGRLVDADGKPMADAMLMYEINVFNNGGYHLNLLNQASTTAADGTFTLKNLIPGEEYALRKVKFTDGNRGEMLENIQLKPVTVAKAENLEVGDVPLPKVKSPFSSGEPSASK